MQKSPARDKLKKWVDKNPDGYLQKTLKQIAIEVGVSQTSVSNNLFRIIATRDGILPSEVMAKRNETWPRLKE